MYTETFGKTHVNGFEFVLTFSKLGLQQKKIYQVEETHLSAAKYTGG